MRPTHQAFIELFPVLLADSVGGSHRLPGAASCDRGIQRGRGGVLPSGLPAAVFVGFRLVELAPVLPHVNEFDINF